MIKEAINLHLEGMKEDGTPIPTPYSEIEYLEIDHKRYRQSS